MGKAHTLEHYEIFNTTQLSWLPRILVDDIKLTGLDPEYFEEMEEYVNKTITFTGYFSELNNEDILKE